MSQRVPSFATVLLAAADASKELIVAPDSGLAIRILAIHWSIVTSAAQLTKVGKDGGTEAEQVLELAASASGNGTRRFNDNGPGWKMPAATALTAKPAAAGPAIHFIVEYTVEQN